MFSHLNAGNITIKPKQVLYQQSTDETSQTADLLDKYTMLSQKHRDLEQERDQLQLAVDDLKNRLKEAESSTSTMKQINRDLFSQIHSKTISAQPSQMSI